MRQGKWTGADVCRVAQKLRSSAEAATSINITSLPNLPMLVCVIICRLSMPQCALNICSERDLFEQPPSQAGKFNANGRRGRAPTLTALGSCSAVSATTASEMWSLSSGTKPAENSQITQTLQSERMRPLVERLRAAKSDLSTARDTQSAALHKLQTNASSKQTSSTDHAGISHHLLRACEARAL